MEGEPDTPAGNLSTSDTVSVLLGAESPEISTQERVVLAYQHSMLLVLTFLADGPVPPDAS